MSNPVVDAHGQVWFVSGSKVYRADATKSDFNRLSPDGVLGYSGLFGASVYRNDERDDLLIWIPGNVEVTGKLLHLDTTTGEAGDAHDVPLFTPWFEAARVGDELWICAADGLYRAATTGVPSRVREPCAAVAAHETFVFVADEVGIHELLAAP